MSRPSRKRPRPEDPLASDPEDEDYTDVQPREPKRQKPVKHRSRSKAGSSKRARRGSGYAGSDSEIVDDEDDISESSFTNESNDEGAPPARVTRSGRPERRAAPKNTLAESDEDEDADADEDIEISDAESYVSEKKIQTSNEPTKLIVRLRIPTASMPSNRGQKSVKGVKKEDTPGPARRSSRISHNDDEALVALTDSGRHEIIVREGSAPPESSNQRVTRGGKSLPNVSAIVEASEEESEHDKEIAATQEVDEAEQVQPTTEDAPEEGNDEPIVMESDHPGGDDGNADDEDDEPVTSRKRKRSGPAEKSASQTPRKRRRTAGDDGSSDFEPGNEAENEGDEDDGDDSSESEPSQKRRVASKGSTSSGTGRRSERVRKRKKTQSPHHSDDSADLDEDELAEEAADLQPRKRPRRETTQHEGIIYDNPRSLRDRGQKKDYRLIRPEVQLEGDDQQAPISTPSRGGRATGASYRSLFPTHGPFGGIGGPPPPLLYPTAEGPGAAGGADSDSSDDDAAAMQARKSIGATVGATPTSAKAPGLVPQALNTDPLQNTSGAPANFGKVRDKKALADADPLGNDPNVTFKGVGGLGDHVNQLKEMVLLPLLYPEVFERFHVTPPRGVLFHGPPGTGKTLLARALSSSVSSGGKKVTFYMRKGADALSKWVGEAERQLRLLFEEARKNQPAIIFFDEIDGLAPVRSSKQEQIHASIVATLLALMDGMDGRGQVIVIGATNRPDSVDPALRRPGRFDREFYFPLPDEKARREIIDIHTSGWEPPLDPRFKDQLASLTSGYGGADLRALCTEAALNAVQGTYPQIYQSDEKLAIDPSKIKVLAKDFMISINRMIPSSGRSGGTATAAGLETSVEPLLRDSVKTVTGLLDEILPQKRKPTALEEAEFDDRDDIHGFEREILQQDFDKTRIFRPRMLIYGLSGMGQQYIGSAILKKFERLFVQSFDISALYSDTGRSPEAAVVQLFNEAKRHKPCIIYIPNVDVWYNTVGESVIRLFTNLLRTIPPNDPILVLGYMDIEGENDKPNQNLLKDLFPFSRRTHVQVTRPNESQRYEFFEKVTQMIKTAPSEFPDQADRKKRQLEVLKKVVQPRKDETEQTKVSLKEQKKHDRRVLNLLKIRIGNVMPYLKKSYRKFMVPVVDPSLYGYLYDEQDPTRLSSDLTEEQRAQVQNRPYEMATDDKGIGGIREVETGRFFYNLELITIERRLSNGFYKRAKDFLADIKRLAKDAKTLGDSERILKANEMVANIEVDMYTQVEMADPGLAAACEEVYQRERLREQMQRDEASKARLQGKPVPQLLSNIPHHISNTTTETSGPIMLGEEVPGRPNVPTAFPSPLQRFSGSQITNGYSQGYGGGGQTTISNGSSEDVRGFGSQDLGAVRGENAAEGPHSAPHTQTHRSQRSSFMPMAPNSQLQEYHNSASTTSSGQKTSSNGKSIRSQATNGTARDEFPNFDVADNMTGGSQLPDTQEMNYHSSQQSQNSPPSPASQQMPPPGVSRNTNATSLLNAAEATAAAQSGVTEEVRQPVYDVASLEAFHKRMTEQTSGCSVEQLEQINAALMDAVWRKRSEWNRNIVLAAVREAYNVTINDIEEMQKILPNSQGTGDSSGHPRT